MTDHADIEAKFTHAIDGDDPTTLAAYGEIIGYEANGPVGNPSPETWIRAGLAASLILQTCRQRGGIPVAMLVAVIADAYEPAHDGETQRGEIIKGYRSIGAPT